MRRQEHVLQRSLHRHPLAQHHSSLMQQRFRNPQQLFHLHETSQWYTMLGYKAGMQNEILSSLVMALATGSHALRRPFPAVVRMFSGLD
jgi:hypothetical protein